MQDFQKFKPVCVELLKSPTIGRLEYLRSLIENAKSDSMNELQEYILFPLYIILSNKAVRNEKIIFAVCNCIKSLCEKSTLKIFKVFSDYLLQLLLLADDSSPLAEGAQVQSEEVKLAALETILVILRAASNDVILQLLSDTNKAMYGHLIFLTLKIAVNEDLKELRLIALDCLNEAICFPYESLSGLLIRFFPGICTSMFKIIDGNIKQSYLVTQKAISVFSTTIQLVLNNQRVDQFKESETEWLKQTKKNLHVVLGKMCKITDFHWKVKLELVSMFAMSVEICSNALELSLSLLIRKLVQFTVEERTEVQIKAKKATDHLSIAEVNFDSALRQNLYDIVTTLPRILTQGIPREQHLILEELHGHLNLLGTRLDQSLIFSGLRERLFKSLLIAAAMEPAKVMEGDLPYTLTYLRDNSVIKSFIACCLAIGKNSNLMDTTDYLLEILRQKDSYSCESVYVMLHVILEASVDIFALTNVVQEYGNALSTVSCESRSNVILGQLLLRVIGEAAKLMNTSFNDLLLKILRPVLEKAGHPDFHAAGLFTLECIVEALQFRSVSHLLEANADYFAPQLTYQLCSIMRYPKAIDLLRALLLLSDVRLENWLERMVQQALKGLDKVHLVQALPYIQVFELYCKAIQKSRTSEAAVGKPLCKNDIWCPDEVVRMISEHKTSLKTCETLLEGDIEPGDVLPPEAETIEFEDDPAKDRQATPSILLVAEIVGRCIQLLPQSQDDRLHESVMQSIHFSIKILSSYENIFLPKVHQLWEPLKNELMSSSHLRQRQAFDILIALITTCPDFIRHRVFKEILPRLVGFLNRQAGVSRNRLSRAHLASQAYKLQKFMLSSIGMLVQYLDPSTTDVITLVQTTSTYLSKHQITELQCLAKENITLIAKYHPGAVWLTLNSLVSPPFTVETENIESEYSENVEELLVKLFPLNNLTS